MARTHTDRILFGAAYYDEYMPKDLDRVDEDMRMMKEAGINLIRIAESTWSTEEPQPGVFDFTHIDRALDAAQRAGIDVIVGTPTYAVPTWMVKMHPEVLAVTPAGPGKYGARQIMDIVNPTYRFYAERIIRRLIAHVADHPAVIGYQVDNETKYYDSVSPDMQALFVKYLRETTTRSPRTCRPCSSSTCARGSTTTWTSSTPASAWTTGPTASTHGRTSRM